MTPRLTPNLGSAKRKSSNSIPNTKFKNCFAFHPKTTRSTSASAIPAPALSTGEIGDEGRPLVPFWSEVQTSGEREPSAGDQIVCLIGAGRIGRREFPEVDIV